MSIDQIKGLPTEVFEIPQWQDANYTEGPEEDKAISLGEIMDQNFSRNSINLDNSPHESPEAEEKVDTLSMIMSHGSPVYQVQVKGTSDDDFSLHPEKDPFNLQPTLSSSKNELHLNLEKQIPDFDSNHSQNENSPTWNLNTQEIRSEMQNLENRDLARNPVGKFATASSAFQKYSENKKDKSPFEGLPSNIKINRHASEASNTRKKWAKLGHVIHSLALLKREEVKNIIRSDDMNDEITSFKIGKVKAASERDQDFVLKNNFEGDAFDLVRRVQLFCDCAAIGSPEHIKMMAKLIERDPKKFMIEPNDPQHLLNKTNSQGWSPLYIAAKYGNLNVVKLLIENKANSQLKCRINPNHSKEELPLKVATKWGHAEVVDYLLKNGEYDKSVLKSCIKKSPNPSVRAILEKYQKEALRSKSEMNIFSKWFLK